MTETKHPLTSKTIWTSILQLVASILVATGVLTSGQGDIITGVGPEILVGIAGSLLAAVSAWGRLTAKTSLKKAAKGVTG